MANTNIRAAGRALAWRFLNEGPEKIDRMLSGELPIDQAVLGRLEKPVSDREIMKWASKEITEFQWSGLCLHRRAVDKFEKLVAQIGSI